MRALSIWQPWATLIAHGLKRIETRSWETRYRGPLLIHAARKWTRELKSLCHREPFRTALTAIGYDSPDLMPFGAIVAVAELVDCRPTSKPPRAGVPCDLLDIPGAAHLLDDARRWVERLDERERAFGDFSPGRYGWSLSNVRRLARPLTATGWQGLWPPGPGVVAMALERLAEGAAHAG